MPDDTTQTFERSVMPRRTNKNRITIPPEVVRALGNPRYVVYRIMSQNLIQVEGDEECPPNAKKVEYIPKGMR